MASTTPLVTTRNRSEDMYVEIAAALVEERPIRDLVSQRVLEGVLDLGKEARLVEELAGLQPDEPGAEYVRIEAADGLEEWQRHVLSDGGSRLQQMLVRHRKAIDARRQDRLDRGRHLRRRERSGQAMRAVLAGEHAVLDQRPHALLEEERVTLGALNKQPLERLQGRMVAQETRQERASALGRQRIQAELAV